MSSIIYGAKQRRLFKKLFKSIQELKKEVSLDVKKLCAFHKSRIYNIEREVRLLYDGREKKAGTGRRRIHSANGELLFPKIEQDSRIRYLYLPIFRDDLNMHYYEDLPIFRIEKIHLGFGHKYDTGIKKELEEALFKSLGYAPEVCFSRLVGAYWGKV